MNSKREALAALLVQEGLSLEGVPVKCSCCGGWFHQLTARYHVEEEVLRGSGLELVRQYREYGWYDFPHEDWVVGENVQCPQCMMPYSPGEIFSQVEKWLAQALEVKNGLKAEEKGAEEEEAVGETPQPDAPPESIGDLAVPGVVGGESPAADDGGLPGGATGLAETVRKMSWDGHTQAEIAKTCGISVYMVREIQNGRKV